MLHLVDNEKRTNNDKLYKLGNLHQKLNINFYKAYTPERNLAVDEQMIGTKCRVSFLQYMPAKPKKFGIKLWALCESSSGYCLQFQIYKGKELDTPEKGLSHRVVMDLAQNYFHANYHIYMDNFYTSPDLFVALAAMDTYACGTIRKNRGQFPTNFKDSKLKRGESLYIQTDDLLAVHWFDKRDVFMLSTIHGTGSVEVQRRGDKETIQKPLMISKYNTHMGGVDLCDQLLSSYSMQRKSKKWWKKVFYRLIELSVLNSLVIYKKLNPRYSKNNRAHLYFREVLVHELVQELLDERADPHSTQVEGRGRPTDVDSVRLRGKHFATSIYPARKTCSVCGYKTKNAQGKQIRKKTSNFCKVCNLPICKDCFSGFHTNSQL